MIGGKTLLFLVASAGAIVLGGAASLAIAGSQAAAGKSWDLEAAYAGALNANPDGAGFSFRYSTSLQHAPSAYKLLPQFEDPLAFRGAKGLAAWQCVPGNGGCVDAAKLPFVGINHTGAAVKAATAVWPAHSVDVHPASNQFAVVAWKSPVTGAVAVTGAVKDADGVAGNGIDWFVDKGASTLASGVIPNKGAQAFSAGTGGPALVHIPVTAGQSLYFLVGSNGDEGYDTTALTVKIATVGSTSTSPAKTTPGATTTKASSPGKKKPTFTAVVCNIVVNGSGSTCTAQVADASPQRSNPPTGTVRFHASAGTVGASCTLAGTPGSPGIASCTVSYVPSANAIQGEPPPVSATYGGDATFAASSGAGSYTPASVVVPTTATVVDVTGGSATSPPTSESIPADLENPNPFPVSADEALTVPGNMDAPMLRTGSVAGIAVRPKPRVIAHRVTKLKPLTRSAGTLKLTAVGRKLLFEHHRLKATVTITTRAKDRPVKTFVRRISIRSKP